MSTLLNEIFQEMASTCTGHAGCTCDKCRLSSHVQPSYGKHGRGCICSHCKENQFELQELNAPTGKLSTAEKGSYRAQATRGRDKIKEWRDRCKKLKAQGKDRHIHHIIPLQYIHLFKGRHPNKIDNVVLVPDDIHRQIHAALRARIQQAKTAEEKKEALEKFKRYILRNYKRFILPQSFKQPILKEIFNEVFGS